MLLITAPSKTQTSRDSAPDLFCEQFSLPVFFENSRLLNAELAGRSHKELCKLMNMSEALGESTRRRIKDFRDELRPDNALPAIFTFQGDAYSSLTPEKYDHKQLRHAQHHLRILSGLYGILRPLDLMFPYRLEMATRLRVGSSANLYQFWGDRITDNINQDLADMEQPVLVNLASTEYAKVVHPKKLNGRMLAITFKEKKGTGYRTIPIHSKRARGMMIHFMITEKLTSPADLKEFSAGGYGFRPDLSAEEEWIFTRD